MSLRTQASSLILASRWWTRCSLISNTSSSTTVLTCIILTTGSQVKHYCPHYCMPNLPHDPNININMFVVSSVSLYKTGPSCYSCTSSVTLWTVKSSCSPLCSCYLLPVSVLRSVQMEPSCWSHSGSLSCYQTGILLPVHRDTAQSGVYLSGPDVQGTTQGT